MRNVRIVTEEDPLADLDYWLKKTPEERLDAVEFLREQFYVVQGHTEVPRIQKVVHKIEMKE